MSHYAECHILFTVMLNVVAALEFSQCGQWCWRHKTLAYYC